MTIKTVITQMCDGCKETRDLELHESHELGGWRPVKTNRHLCPKCIDKAIGQS